MHHFAPQIALILFLTSACGLTQPKSPHRGTYQAPDRDYSSPQGCQVLRCDDESNEVDGSQKSDENAAPANNKPPQIERIPTKEARAGRTFSLSVFVTDPNDDKIESVEFSTAGDVLPTSMIHNGTLLLSIPADITSQAVKATVTAKDSWGASSSVHFQINIVGVKEDSAVKQAIIEACAHLTDPIQNAACIAGSGLLK